MSFLFVLFNFLCQFEWWHSVDNLCQVRCDTRIKSACLWFAQRNSRFCGVAFPNILSSVSDWLPMTMQKFDAFICQYGWMYIWKRNKNWIHEVKSMRKKVTMSARLTILLITYILLALNYVQCRLSLVYFFHQKRFWVELHFIVIRSYDSLCVCLSCDGFYQLIIDSFIADFDGIFHSTAVAKPVNFYELPKFCLFGSLLQVLTVLMLFVMWCVPDVIDGFVILICCNWTKATGKKLMLISKGALWNQNRLNLPIFM